MLKNLPRRKRQILLTSVSSAVFVVLVVFVMALTSDAEAPYQPGQEIEGITNALARDLPEDYPRVTFTDVAEAAGIDFHHFPGTRTSQLPEDMGSGAAWGDFDGDGWVDLFVANEVGPITMSPEEVERSPASCKLYRNNGDGTFTDVTSQAGVDYRGWAMGAAWGDYDGDGRLDLVVTTHGYNVLYRNNGDGTFTDVSEASGIGKEKGFWSGAAWADYDRDGRLDLYVTGYVQYVKPKENTMTLQYDIENPAAINPSSFAPQRNLLFRNNGNGTFTEMALKAGVANEAGKSLAAAWADFDEDGWLDLYVANDVSDNVFYRNLGNGTFEDVSHPAWVADHRGAMGLAVGDWDNDADLDIFVTHWIAQENALYTNQLAQTRQAGAPALRFLDEADQYGLGQIALDYVGWGTSFFDYDNDGRLDLFVVNGNTLQEPDDETELGVMRSQLFWNRGRTEGFFNVSPVAGDYFNEEYVGRGAAFADYDNDGDVDVFVVNHGGKAVLLRNDGGNQRNWLQVALKYEPGNPDAHGARLRLVAGATTQVRQVGAQASYASQNSPVEHFGLGDATHVDTLEITWPDGSKKVLTDLSPGRRIVVTRDQPL